MTIKEFLEEVTKEYVESELRGLVASELLDSYDTDEDILGYMDDITKHGGVSGIIRTLIYHDKLEDFFNKYAYDIFELAKEVGFDRSVSEFDSATDFFDTMAWFGYEETVYQLLEEFRESVRLEQ